MAEAIFSNLGYHVVEKKNISPEKLETIKKSLSRFGINTPIKEKEFEWFLDSDEFPYTKGFNNYNELLNNYVKVTCEQQIEIIEDFYSNIFKNGIPKSPSLDKIKIVQGWSKYNKNGEFIERIEAPKDKILVFDTETYVLGQNLPIIATATGLEYSYIWIAKEFVDYTKMDDYDQFGLVPLPNTEIIIGHNIMFDMARVRESYIFPQKIYGLDTLSMHIMTNGLCSQQRFASVLEQKDKDELTWKEKAILRNPPKWLQYGTTNSLVAVYNFHVAHQFSGKEKLSSEDKEIRDVFVKTPSMDDFVLMGEFRKKLVYYAAKDTFYTTEIFKELYPKFRESKPHKASLSGFLLLSQARVPLVKNWDEWVNNCEKLLEDFNKEASDIIKEACLELYNNWCDGTLTILDIEKDPFLSQLKWNIKRKKIKKNYNSKIYSKLREIEKKEEISLQDIPVNLREYYSNNSKNFFNTNYDYMPEWYEPFFKNPDIIITPKTEISHLILRLHYNGYPLYKHKNKGWGYFIEDDKFEKVKSYGVPGANVGKYCSL